MKTTLKLGDWNSECMVCGFKYKASQLRERWDGMIVCPEDFENKHPLDTPRLAVETNVAFNLGGGSAWTGVPADVDTSPDYSNVSDSGSLPAVNGLSATATEIDVDATATFTITIEDTCPEDQIITLSQTDASVTSIPATATVLAGETSVTFTATGLAGGSSTITATLNNSSLPFSITVNETLYALIISEDTSDYNVYDAFVAAYGTPPADVTLSVTVNSGVVVIGSTGESTIAGLTWGSSWTGTPTFTLINLGYIIGTSGGAPNGGDAGVAPPAYASNGFAGGAGTKAIELSGQTVTITNADGRIWGGGGSGGSGGGVYANAVSDGWNLYIGGGGGGAGAGKVHSGGPAGNGQSPGTVTSTQSAGGSQSAPIIEQSGSAGGNFGQIVQSGATITSGSGGAGGGFGEAGSSGTDATAIAVTDEILGTGGAGGAAGKAINLTGGSAIFISGSGSPNVKGAVS